MNLTGKIAEQSDALAVRDISPIRDLVMISVEDSGEIGAKEADRNHVHVSEIEVGGELKCGIRECRVVQLDQFSRSADLIRVGAGAVATVIGPGLTIRTAFIRRIVACFAEIEIRIPIATRRRVLRPGVLRLLGGARLIRCRHGKII